MSLVSRCVKKINGTKSNFTIDHILSAAGEKPKLDHFRFLPETIVVEREKFEWLNCTRYRPPKLPRQRKKEGIQKRRLGRNPRIPFSSSQVAFLEAKFLRTPYLSSSDVSQLASYLKLSENRVKIWFQNRRAREKREKDGKNVPGKNSTKETAAERDGNSTPSQPPLRILSIDPRKSLALPYDNGLRYINYGEEPNFVRLIHSGPLDLVKDKRSASD